jgi:CRP/FNR family transcriptional regulator, nitrogen oxide reductase regulator
MAQIDPSSQAKLLERVGLFQNLSSANIAKILELARTRRLPQDAFCFHQGDPATLLYVLTKGQVKLSQITPEGNQVLLRFIHPGEMFGGVAAFGDSTYPVSAEAVQDCIVLTWDTATLVRMMETYPPIALNAMRHLVQRVQELQQRNLELATERVERRIAHALLRLARASGRPVDGGVLIDLALSRQDLAEMTGTTIYTVSRTLSAWQQRGLIQAGRERVLIREPHGLTTIAEDLPMNTGH